MSFLNESPTNIVNAPPRNRTKASLSLISKYDLWGLSDLHPIDKGSDNGCFRC